MKSIPSKALPMVERLRKMTVEQGAEKINLGVGAMYFVGKPKKGTPEDAFYKWLISCENDREFFSAIWGEQAYDEAMARIKERRRDS